MRLPRSSKCLLGVAVVVCATSAQAQERSLLRDLPPLQVVVDWALAPITEATADSLRNRVIARLREAGVPVTEAKAAPVLFAPQYAFARPTFLVSLNMVPDGCAFVVNFFVRMPVSVAGYGNKLTLSVYASRSYIYRTTWTDHSPVLNFLDDFVDAWRGANQR